MLNCPIIEGATQGCRIVGIRQDRRVVDTPTCQQYLVYLPGIQMFSNQQIKIPTDVASVVVLSGLILG